MFIDTHCHLDCLEQSPLECLQEAAKDSGLSGCITIGLRYDTFAKMHAMFAGKNNIWFSVGNHPSEQFEQEPSISELTKYAGLNEVVAIGETGLDFYYDFVDKKTQKQRFEQQIILAKSVSKPLIIHCRDALDDLLEMLKYHAVDNFVMHCFTGDAAQAEQCLELGAYISYSGIVTFKNAQANQEAAKITPLERLLIETDSPYLTPVPFRGKPNNPGMVKYVAAKIAEIKQCELTDIARITTKNACEFFNIKLADNAFL